MKYFNGTNSQAPKAKAGVTSVSRMFEPALVKQTAPFFRKRPETVRDAAIQRKIKVNDGVDLDTKGFTVTRSDNSYSCPEIVKNSSLLVEIFTAMLHSNVAFKLAGETNAAANESLQKQLAARLGIIEFAGRKKHYIFGAGGQFKMNPEFWIVEKDGKKGYRPKPGVDRQEAIEDLTKQHQADPLYAISCQVATDLTMEGGGKSEPIPEAAFSTDDWVPGDAGYIKNESFDKMKDLKGLEGENIIYMGKNKFWGHLGRDLVIKSLQEWMDDVNQFQTDAAAIAVVSDDRFMPGAGLEK